MNIFLILELIQHEYSMYCQTKRKKPNLLLLSTVGKFQLQYESLLLDGNEIKTGSRLLDCDVVIVDECDLDGKMFKWIRAERG